MKQFLLTSICAFISAASIQATPINLWVTNASSTVYEFNGATGAPDGTFTAQGPVSRLTDYNGNVYLLDSQNNAVYEYSNNGTYLGTIVKSASGRPFDATNIVFGPDGDLYITLGETGWITRYSATGTFLGVFGTGPGGVSDLGGAAFRSDGLYVADYQSQQILVYGLGGGTPTVVNPSAGQVDSLAFGPTGDLFDSNDTTGQIYDLTAATAFASGFEGTPRGMQFEPDGFLYVASQEGNAIYRVDGTNGGTAAVFASGEGLTNALDFAFVDATGSATPEPSTCILLLLALIAGSAIPGCRRAFARQV